MTLTDLAENLHYNDLLETDDTSVAKILKWLQDNLGQLNDLIATNYQISENDASPELGIDEAGIFGIIYLMNYYQRQIQSNLGASAYDWSEVVEADTRVRRVSRNEIAKSYRFLSNDSRDYLYRLVESYKKFKCVPVSYRSDFFVGITKVVVS